MKNHFLSSLHICIFICIQFIGFSQQASNVLENGIKVSSGKKLFFRFSNGILKYDLQKSLSDDAIRPDFIPLKDSSIFLVEKGGINIYIRPLNPLLFEYEKNVEIKTDPINDQVMKLMDGWESQINTLPKITKDRANKDAGNTIELDIIAIKNKLNNDSIIKIIEVYNILKNLDFANLKTTEEGIRLSSEKLMKINAYYNSIERGIDSLKAKIKQKYEGDVTLFTEKYILNQISNELAQVLEELKKKYASLEQAFNLVNNVKQKALTDPDGLLWCINLSEVDIQDGKIAEYTIIVKNSNYSISEKGIISKSDSKEIMRKKIQFRKFKRFVPEVSGGALFTFIDYNTYGIQTDQTGDQVIAFTGKKELKNLKFSGMINYTCFIPNSDIHPFYQIGLAINSEIPTIATGLGIRSNLNGSRRFTISVGIASTWVKGLDKLKIGDKVNGSADLENDLKYQFVWPPRPYIGFHRNF